MTTTDQDAASGAPARQRMLTGDRPTGRLHLGHYVGSIENRVRLQHDYETFIIIADLHMLTTKNTRKDIDEVAGNARDMVLDQLSAGIDPEQVTFYLQSAIPEVFELTMVPGRRTASRFTVCKESARRRNRAPKMWKRWPRSSVKNECPPCSPKHRCRVKDSKKY